MFLLLFTFWAFPYSSFFFVTKDGHINIFKPLVVAFSANWKKHHEKSFAFLQIIFEEWHLQYNEKRCLTSFPRLTRLVCCGKVSLFCFPTVLIDVSSLQFGCKFFVQAFSCAKNIACKSYCKNSAIMSFPCFCTTFEIMGSSASSPFLKCAISVTRFLFRFSFCNVL